jgi:hypothetical protein
MVTALGPQQSEGPTLQGAKAQGISPFTMLCHIAVFALVVGLGVAFARRTLSMMYRDYDDEGYMLLSLLHYFRDGGLYTKTYSQYGPFYFWAQTAWFRLLHLPITLDAGRLVTLLYWMLSGFFGGHFVYRFTKNLLLASVGTLACIIEASALANEPGHPQQVVLLLLMMAAWFSVWGGSRTRTVHLFFLGAIGAALLLTKINIGVFFIAALAHSLCCMLRPGFIRTATMTLTVFYAVVGPVVLMSTNLFGWAGMYCLMAVLCGGMTFLCGSWLRPDDPLPPRGVLGALAGLVVAAGLIIGGTLAQGVEPNVLFRGVVLDPLKHPGVFSRPMPLGNSLGMFLLLAAGGTFWTFLSVRRGSRHRIGALQCAAGLGVLFLIPVLPYPALVMPFLPLGLISCLNRARGASYLFPRVFVTDMAATQFLQPYPVAGSHLAIAAAPMVLWAFMCIFDGFDELLDILGIPAPPSRPVRRQAVLAAVMLFAFSLGFVRLYYSGFWLPYPYPASTLNGSRSLHLPPDEERRYRFLADSISGNCSMLFTVPGMGSFNFWSGVPTPNGSNLTVWINAFDAQRQEQILKLLVADNKACVLYNPHFVQFWTSSTEQLGRSKLGAYIMFDMVKVAELDGYEIRVQPGRSDPWGAHR